MGDYKAGVGIVGILGYFILLYIIIFSLNNTLSDTGLDTVEVTGESGILLASMPYNVDGACENPRFYYTDSGKRIDFLEGLRQIQCTTLVNGNPDIDTCNNVSGCEWVDATNGTVFFFFDYSTDAYCDGNINLSSFHNETLEFSDTTNQGICGGLSNVTYNKDNCELLSCTWTDIDELREREAKEGSINDIKSIWETVKFITALNISPDIPEDYAWIFSIILFWLPFIGLLICVYFSLPFVH